MYIDNFILYVEISVVACALDAILNLSDGNAKNKERMLTNGACSTIINLIAAKLGDSDTDTLCRAFNTVASLVLWLTYLIFYSLVFIVISTSDESKYYLNNNRLQITMKQAESF